MASQTPKAGRRTLFKSLSRGRCFVRLWSEPVAPRPYWKGYLKLSLVSCSIAIYPATSSSERVSFNQINSKTGSRIKYKKVDADTGDEVEAADIVKGYQVEKNVYVTI